MLQPEGSRRQDGSRSPWSPDSRFSRDPKGRWWPLKAKPLARRWQHPLSFLGLAEQKRGQPLVPGMGPFWFGSPLPCSAPPGAVWAVSGHSSMPRLGGWVSLMAISWSPARASHSGCWWRGCHSTYSQGVFSKSPALGRAAPGTGICGSHPAGKLLCPDSNSRPSSTRTAVGLRFAHLRVSLRGD